MKIVIVSALFSFMVWFNSIDLSEQMFWKCCTSGKTTSPKKREIHPQTKNRMELLKSKRRPKGPRLDPDPTTDDLLFRYTPQPQYLQQNARLSLTQLREVRPQPLGRAPSLGLKRDPNTKAILF
ncbi:uncharacterized protein LOC117168451 [Belonocnema kinseyi]|uniref:uncharacterized protein LOC117168451 n=1 Tax=Belonocnema kinseyi TaxID=2817044 RepID=UPI00143D08EA|nr:uncharacterized protein LOC117168451 [Belonocnema kinseyi]